MGFRNKNKRFPFAAPALFGAGLFVLSCFASDYSGQRYFRYTDSRGDIVIANQVPRQDAVRGYEIVTESGRVLEVVAPELSEEARQEKSFQQVRERQKQQQNEQQAAEDAELVRLYSSIDDVHRTRERVLDEIRSRLAVIDANIQRLKVQHEQKQRKAAGFERAGQNVPEGLLQELGNIKTSMGSLEQQIKEFDREKGLVRAKYGVQAERVRFLLEGDRVVDRNKDLKLKAGNLTGRWRPVQPTSGLSSWEADRDGNFILTVSPGKHTHERLFGSWSLNRSNMIVVLYARKEVTRAGKTVRESLAIERRYPVMDIKAGDLYLDWEGKVLRFKRQ